MAGDRLLDAADPLVMLLTAVKNAQALFTTESDPKAVFAGLLKILVESTQSEYGFLDEVAYHRGRPVRKRSLALSDISWDEASRHLYEQLALSDFVFPNLENLAGAPAVSGQVVIANDPVHDLRSRGVPSGHPPIRCYLGIPIRYGGEIVGVAGVANRAGGYTQQLVAFIEPLTTACAAMIVAMRDRKKAQESEESRRCSQHELQESENRYRTIVETAREGIWAMDAGFRTYFVNPRMALMLGYEPEEMLGRSFEEFVFEDDLAAHSERVAERRSGRSGEYERRLRRKDGSTFWATVSATTMTDDQGRFAGSFVMVTDVTQRREDENRLDAMRLQLQHTSRLAVMGELAAGIAHEVNQPLCSIVNFAKACRNLACREPADLDQIRQWLDAIATAANRAGDIVHRMLGFARREAALCELVSVRRLIEDAVLLVRHQARSLRVAVEVEMPEDDPQVPVYPVGIQQVLVNLLRNGIEALAAADAVEKRIVVAVKRLADRVEISVADSGSGVSDDELSRLFEPFYTTKPQGLGLGLAISRTIIEDHGGNITATLNSSGGLTFRFTLPTRTFPAEDA
ncbi:MAG: PAS domain S-box protein [Planctomycetaceae bacterium]|nr:PAS domain S-box protein [Planctomycetaceae bacterium]